LGKKDLKNCFLRKKVLNLWTFVCNIYDMDTSNEKGLNILNEAVALYARQSPSIFYSEFKKSISYKDFLADKMLIILAIRNGIPYSFFEAIFNFAPFSENDWADFLDVSTKSLQRYKSAANHRFKPIHSEKIIEIAEVTYAGLDVFGDMDKFSLWLNTPNFALGNLKPFDLLKDSYGKELVLSELVRIDHGILA
jgi:putative toxin-antitoxin system antitoxin component (TIGR02293 family)